MDFDERGHRHGPDWHHRGQHGEFGRRRRKVFNSQELQLLLLSLIAETPRHGYELIRELEERSNTAYSPSPGMVYPSLTLLTEMGHAEEAETSGARKVFTATDTGRQNLVDKAEQLSELMGRLAMLAERTGRVDAAPVRRALGNLRSAIRGRLSKEGVEEETIFAVAQLIDEVAGKIERLK